MPANVIKTKRDEHLWSEATEAVNKQYPKISEGSERFYRLVMGTYKKMQEDGTTTAKKASTAKSSGLPCPGSKIRSGGQGQGLGRGGGKGPLGVPQGAKSVVKAMVLMAKGDRIFAGIREVDLAKAGPIKGRPGLVLAPSKIVPGVKRWQKVGKEGGLKQLTPQQVIKKLSTLAKWSRQFESGAEFKKAFLKFTGRESNPAKAPIYEESMLKRNGLTLISFWQAAQKAK